MGVGRAETEEEGRRDGETNRASERKDYHRNHEGRPTNGVRGDEGERDVLGGVERWTEKREVSEIERRGERI